MEDSEDYGVDEYSGMDEDGQNYPQNGLPETLIQKLPLLLFVIAVVFIGFYLYTAVIGSSVEITIVVKNLENQAISNNNLLLQLEGKTDSIKKSGESTYALTVKTGKYTLTVLSPGYVTQTSSIEVKEDQTSFPVSLEKDIPVQLSVVSGTTGTVGETIQVPVTLTNKTNILINNLEIVVKNVSEPTAIVTLEPSTVSIPGNERAQIALNVKIPSDLKLDRDNIKRISGTVKVKYTRIFADFNLIVQAAPDLDISPNTISIQGNANEQQHTTLTLRNRSPTRIENVQLQIELLNSTKNEKDSVKNWFIFSASGTPTLTLSSVQGNETKTIDLLVQIPATAKPDTIAGNLVLTSATLSTSIKKPLTLQIQHAVNVGLSLTPSADTVQVPFDPTLGKYKKVLDKKITLENTGDVSLQDISMSVQNRDTCTDTWLSFSSETNVHELTSREQRPIFIVVNAPQSIRGNETALVCTVIASYFDPIENIRKEKDTQIRIIPEA